MTLFLFLLLMFDTRPVTAHHGYRPTRPAVTALVHPTAPIIRLYNQW